MLEVCCQKIFEGTLNRKRARDCACMFFRERETMHACA